MRVEHHLAAEILDTKTTLVEMENLLKNARALGFGDDDYIRVSYHPGDPRDQRESDWMTLEVRKKAS